MNEAYFKEIKINKGDSAIDVEAATKHIDTVLKTDTAWKTVMETGIQKCAAEMETKKEEILSMMEKAPFNVPRSKCNAIFLSFSMCMHLDAILNCPSQSFQQSAECNKGKEWLGNCRNRVQSWAVSGGDASSELD